MHSEDALFEPMLKRLLLRVGDEGGVRSELLAIEEPSHVGQRVCRAHSL